MALKKKSLAKQGRLLAVWSRLRDTLGKGDPRRIFVGKYSRESPRVIQTARNAPRYRQKVKPKKRVLVAKKERVMQSIVLAAKCIVSAAIIAAIMYHVLGYLRSSPRFTVAHVAVSGNTHVTAREIIDRSEIAEGGNIFGVDLKERATAIREIPRVHEAVVTRRLPDEVYIEITERAPAALVLSGELYCVDDESRVIGKYDATENLDLPIVTSSTIGPLAPGDTVTLEGMSDALEILRIMRLMGIDDKVPVSEINIDDPKNLLLVAQQSGANIIVGAGDIEGKIWRLQKVAKAIEEANRFGINDLERLDLRFGEIVPAKFKGG